MSRLIPIVALALGCAGLSLQAQETTTKTTTKSSGGSLQTVSFTGCVQAGTEARTYMLNRAVPVRQTTTADASGSSTVTTYMLVPGDQVTVQEHVNHKVEVTGVMIPAGEIKTETQTKVDRDDAKDTKTVEKTRSESDTPRFRVTSIKTVADTCS